MKKALFFALLSAVACSSSPPPKTGYVNVTGQNNEVIAQLNPETRKVKFYQSPEEAVWALIGAVYACEQSKQVKPKKADGKKSPGSTRK